jgi:dihydroneopterin triphosphate diphosphatase
MPRSCRACGPPRLAKPYKIPVSTLVVIYTPDLDVLLIERADHPGFWQSVTGSQDPGETLLETAIREVGEETGIDAAQHPPRDWGVTNVYEIYAVWRHRYAPGVTHNTEHVFGLRLPQRLAPTLAPQEHRDFRWLPWREAANEVFSWSNRQAILMLPEKEASSARPAP